MAGPFRLAGLLRLRKLQEEQAAAILAQANAAHRASVERRVELDGVLADQAFPQTNHDLGWRAAVASRVALSGLVNEAGAAVEIAARRAQLTSEDWSAARTRATTLEKLEERHAVEARAEDERLEQLVLDEAAARRHTAKTTEEDR